MGWIEFERPTSFVPGSNEEHRQQCFGFVQETSTGVEYVDDSVRARKRRVRFALTQRRASFSSPYDSSSSSDDSSTEYASSSDDSSTGPLIHSCPPGEEKWWVNPPQISEESKALLWYNDQEHEAICDQARQVSEYYFSRRHDYTKGFLSVFTFLHQSQGDQDLIVSEDVSLLAHTSARGLEIYIFPILNRCRERAVDAILQAQANLPPNVDYETRQRLLAAKSKHLSKPAIKLAKIFGDGDAMVAMKIRGEKVTGS